MKDFDFCSKCEETKDHPHAFMKITDPSKAPSAIFTVLNETQPQSERWGKRWGGQGSPKGPWGRCGKGPMGMGMGPGPCGGRGGPWAQCQKYLKENGIHINKMLNEGKFEDPEFQQKMQTQIQDFFQNVFTP